MMRKAIVTGWFRSYCGFYLLCGYDWTLHSIIVMKTLYYADWHSEIASGWCGKSIFGGQICWNWAEMAFQTSNSHKWYWEGEKKQQKKAKPNIHFFTIVNTNTWGLPIHKPPYWTHTRRRTGAHTPLVPYSCRCRWCTSRRVGSTPPAAASVGLGSGGSGWILWLVASGGDTWLYLNTTSGWWLTRSQRCWRTLELREKPYRCPLSHGG